MLLQIVFICFTQIFCSLKSLQGCLVVLTDEGDLVCGYLGTEPAVFVPPPVQNSVMSNTELEAKYASLQHQIATYSKTSSEFWSLFNLSLFYYTFFA